MLTRRRFIVAGVAGGAALTAAYWLRSVRQSSLREPLSSTDLEHDAKVIIAAIVPALLDNALPPDPAERGAAAEETVANVVRAIAGLAPSAQKELAQLFSLLAFAPARIAIARVASPWEKTNPAEISAFLDRWRDSNWKLLRSAYNALHQLVYAAWYGNPRSWPAVGYPGPPALSS